MSKINRNQENPIDNFAYDLSIQIAPFLRNLGITPNMVTITSIVLALLSSTNNNTSIVKEVEKSIEKNAPNKPAVPLGN